MTRWRQTAADLHRRSDQVRAQRLLGPTGYLATAQCGIATTTGDAEGEITHRSDRSLRQMTLLLRWPAFQGPSGKAASVFRAQIAGKPAYEYARAGQSVEIAEREVIRFTAVTLLAFDEAPNADVEVLCSGAPTSARWRSIRQQRCAPQASGRAAPRTRWL